MFGNNPGGEILFASIPKNITAQGGGNEPIANSPGRKVDGDGGGPISGGASSPAASSGQSINPIGGDSK